MPVSAPRFTFRQPRTRCVVRDGDNKATRLMLLADTVKGDGALALSTPFPRQRWAVLASIRSYKTDCIRVTSCSSQAGKLPELLEYESLCPEPHLTRIWHGALDGFECLPKAVVANSEDMCLLQAGNPSYSVHPKALKSCGT